MTVLEPVIKFLSDYSETVVTLSQAIKGADRPRKPILRVLDRLAREGYLEEIADDKIYPGLGECGRKRRNPTWRILSKPLLAQFVPRPQHITVRDRMWRLIRARRRFTRSEIIRLSGASLGSATDYTRLLVHYGFLRVIGKDGRQNVYMLVKDPGAKLPLTPEIKKKNVKRK